MRLILSLCWINWEGTLSGDLGRIKDKHLISCLLKEARQASDTTENKSRPKSKSAIQDVCGNST